MNLQSILKHIILLVFISLTVISCKQNKTQNSEVEKNTEPSKEQPTKQRKSSFRISEDNPPQGEIHCFFDTFRAAIPSPNGGDIEVDCWSFGCNGAEIENWEVGGCSDEPDSPVIDDFVASLSPISKKTVDNNKTRYAFSFSPDNPPQGQVHCWFDTFTSVVPTPNGGTIEVDCWDSGCGGDGIDDWHVGGCSDEPDPTGINVISANN